MRGEFTSATVLARKMPFPWQLAAGFIIHIFEGSLLISSCKAWSSLGNMKVLGRKSKCLTPKNKLFQNCTVYLLHSSQQPVHAIFAGDLSRFGEVVHLLVLGKGLIDLRLEVRATPEERPFLVPVGHLSEAVVLERVANQSDISPLVKFKVVAPICWFVRPNRNRVDVGPEYQILLATDLLPSRSHRILSRVYHPFNQQPYSC